MKAMWFTPSAHGGQRARQACAAALAALVPPHPEQVKREGWIEQGILAVNVDDPRLTWPERELVEQLGTRLYGPRPQGEVRHG